MDPGGRPRAGIQLTPGLDAWAPGGEAGPGCAHQGAQAVSRVACVSLPPGLSALSSADQAAVLGECV